MNQNRHLFWRLDTSTQSTSGVSKLYSSTTRVEVYSALVSKVPLQFDKKAYVEALVLL